MYVFIFIKRKILIQIKINETCFQGTSNVMKKKKKKYDDDVDLGAGYDDTDSFIDNTDAVSFFIY